MNKQSNGHRRAAVSTWRLTTEQVQTAISVELW